ncbi:hypothetical protein [Staphylococcus gallinarum]|uniref:hypothetical protein n=1 Tax=Staphylococcus gallinarum TaxID=1293 RepID=UPI002DB61CC4|nr:hypothetical protein [Staphylococcus gallinarum]MEB7040065.1 hypothetical protein [Staphylococcus gallinarum]
MTEIINEKFWKYILLFIILLIWVRIIYNIIYKQDEVIKNYMTIYILYISFALFSTYIPNLLDVNYFNNTLFAIFMFTNSVSLILAIKIFLSTDMKPMVYDFTLLILLFYAGITIISSYFLIGWGSVYYELNMENKDAKNYTLNIKDNKNDTYAYIIAFIYNGFTALKSFDVLEVINVKDVSSKQGNLTADSIIFRMISVFFSFLYISIITAFFMNLFTQGKKKN